MYTYFKGMHFALKNPLNFLTILVEEGQQDRSKLQGVHTTKSSS